MVEKRRALGRGLGALIPTAPIGGGDRPVDVFFRDRATGATQQEELDATKPLLASAASEVAARDEELDAHSESDDRAHQVAAPTPKAEDEGAGGPSGDSNSPTALPGDDDHRLTPVPGAEFAEIALDLIVANPRQPRTVFDEDDLTDLVASIIEVGVLQPIVVRRAPSTPEPDSDHEDTSVDRTPRFELVMGERRWRAAERAGHHRIPAIIRHTDDDDLLRDALLENLHRSQLNALEEAAAYQQLLDDFGCSHEQLASRIGRSRPQISNTLRLLRLPPLVQRRVAAGVLSAGHARAVLGLPDSGAMERMAQRIVAEGLSVRTVEELVALGDDDTGPRTRRPRTKTPQPALDGFTSSLADRLETRVNIVLGQRKGKITVEFASMEDLVRIFEAMGVDSDDPHQHPR